MINKNKLEIKCPNCNKLICFADFEANPEGIYFWCNRCKKDFKINKKELKEANNS